MHWIKVKASKEQIKAIMANPEQFQGCSPNEQCTFTFSKVYYKGGGWWLIAGYSPDGEDVYRVARKLYYLGARDQKSPNGHFWLSEKLSNILAEVGWRLS